MPNGSETEKLSEFAALVRRSGVRASDADLAVVLPIFIENREGLEKLRRALAEDEEPGADLASIVRRITR
jgi:hypothetical protein